MEQKNYRDYTRFIIMTFLFTSSMLLLLRRIFWGGFPRHKPLVDFIPPGYIAMILFAACFWYAVEIIEFLRMNYSVPKPESRFALFFLRILPFAVMLFSFPDYVSFLMPLVIIVIGFYAAVYFRATVAVAALVFIFIIQYAMEFAVPGPVPPFAEPGSQNEYLFIAYKLMNSLLIWLLGFFWKRDHLRWELNQELYADLRESQDRLREYADRVADTVMLEERTRLARDIHDSVGHNLTAASIQLTKAQRYFEIEPQTAKQAMQEAKTCVQEGMGDIRGVLSTLNDEKHEMDIFSQLRSLADRIPADQYIVELDLKGSQDGYNKAVLFALYRMVQEGITNILKHSGARHVLVSANLGEEYLSARIEDDGCGFQADNYFSEEPAAQPAGFGLCGLKDRISLVRGEFHVHSEPGKGVLLTAIMPKQPTKVMDRG